MKAASSIDWMLWIQIICWLLVQLIQQPHSWSTKCEISLILTHLDDAQFNWTLTKVFPHWRSCWIKPCAEQQYGPMYSTPLSAMLQERSYKYWWYDEWTKWAFRATLNAISKVIVVAALTVISAETLWSWWSTAITQNLLTVCCRMLTRVQTPAVLHSAITQRQTE